MSIPPTEQTVIQYVLSRLKSLGIGDVFGVPGDFVYPVCDAVIDDPQLRWIGCSNELNAAYAADGYARTRGAVALVVTYGPGELSTFCGIAGANAERCPVFLLAGMPSRTEQLSGSRLHHMISDQPTSYDLFCKMIEPLTCGAAIITPANCVAETERLIAAALYHRKPVYMAFPFDVPNQVLPGPVESAHQLLSSPLSDPDALAAAIADIVERVSRAKKACFLPGYLLRRYGLVAEAKALIETSGLPFATALQDKGVLPEDHPSFVGMYLGHWGGMGADQVTEFVESCDCIIGLGPEKTEYNTAVGTARYQLKDTVNIMPHTVRVGMAVYDNVEMKDMLLALASRLPRRDDIERPAYVDFYGEPCGAACDEITAGAVFYSRINRFLQPGDIVVLDVGFVANLGGIKMKLPAGVDIETQTAWGAIGWGSAAVLGNAVAAPDRRTILISGEGGHQMTANELGTMSRYGANPIIFVINNSGYLAESATCRNPDEEYNDLAHWQYHKLPHVLGCDDWFCTRVRTVAELDAALAQAAAGVRGCYIEVVMDKYSMPVGAEWVFEMTRHKFNRAGVTWSQWKADHKQQ